MRDIRNEWLEMNKQDAGTATQEYTSHTSATESAPQIHIIREVVESSPVVIGRPAKSGLGAAVAGGMTALIATGAIIVGGVYLSSDREVGFSPEKVMDNDPQLNNNVPVAEIRNSSEDGTSTINSTESVQSTGCSRQLSEIEDIPGAFTRSGSNTDICWSLGEIVDNGFKSSGIVTLWGESPYAGKLDDQLIHDKFLSGDISKSELNALFSSFVIDSSVDTDLVVIDRDRENYYWNTTAGIEKVVVELTKGEE